MAVILLQQYRDADDQESENKRVIADFAAQGYTAIVVPKDISVEWIADARDRVQDVAVIKKFTDTQSCRADALELQKALGENGIISIILPMNSTIELMP